MKWINISQENPRNGCMIRRVDKTNLSLYHIWWEGNKMGVADMVNGGVDYDLSAYEWLDESEEDFYPNVLKYSKEEVDKLLAEQHRNTRHDAIEAITKTYSDGATDLVELVLQMQRDIQSIPQRKPV